MTRYYQLNLDALSLGELWQIHPHVLGFGPLVLRRSLGVPIATRPLVHPESLRRLAPNEVPGAAHRAWEPFIAAACYAGLSVRFYFEMLPENALNDQDIVRGAALLGPDTRYWVILGWVHVKRPRVVLERAVMRCHSRLVGNRNLTTTNDRVRFTRPADAEVVSCLGKPPAAVLETHLARLAALAPADILPVEDQELEAVVLAWAQEAMNHLVRSGKVVPLPDTEAPRAP